MLLNAFFVFFIIESNRASVFGRDSVPDALIKSSTESGLPAEYNADSIFAVLFLARDKKVEIEQLGDDIEITLIESTKR